MTLTEIKVRRARLYPKPARRGPAWYWTYAWTTPVDVDWPNYRDGKPDGTFRRGPRAGGWIDWGRGIGDLRAMLRRKFGRDVVITETWKGAK